VNPTTHPAEKKTPRQREFEALAAQLCAQLTKEEIAALPPYEDHDREVVLVKEKNFSAALKKLKKATFLGFDMEAKPTFIKGQKEHKASLIQIATSRQCFIFFVSAIPQIGELRSIMEDENIVKMGIGLSKDRQRLREEFGMDTRNLVDVSDVFALLGRKNNIGSKQLVAHCLGRNLRKSKNMSRSNWAMYPLKSSQISYAADDAFSSLDAYMELRKMLRPYKGLLAPALLKLLHY